MIVRMPVAIVLAVGLVVLIIVRDKVVEIEAVMGGNEIDAGPRLATTFVEEIAGTRNAFCKIGQHADIALPEAPHRVAKLIIPFRPTRRELADLVATGADIPGLS